jgi:hypothetical protein
MPSNKEVGAGLSFCQRCSLSNNNVKFAIAELVMMAPHRAHVGERPGYLGYWEVDYDEAEEGKSSGISKVTLGD